MAKDITLLEEISDLDLDQVNGSGHGGGGYSAGGGYSGGGNYCGNGCGNYNFGFGFWGGSSS
ncbi:hypothetical protein [Rothia dentocariosa]|uniref:hypothetical protein n=1 Tax=Rothia dentocariosa TaxID=2047 RepID=UPI000C7DCBF6|nr:hypothetical protein [Rothia dentocariosa]MCM3438330.1 hypothetical protein [Rothia dentocariosa]PLA18155.1 hypothetical protein CYK04_09780 [Rothia dentocariosa]